MEWEVWTWLQGAWWDVWPWQQGIGHWECQLHMYIVTGKIWKWMQDEESLNKVWNRQNCNYGRHLWAYIAIESVHCSEFWLIVVACDELQLYV